MHLNRKLFNFNTYSKFASTHSFFFPYRLLQQKKKGSENSENFDSEKKKTNDCYQNLSFTELFVGLGLTKKTDHMFNTVLYKSATKQLRCEMHQIFEKKKSLHFYVSFSV